MSVASAIETFRQLVREDQLSTTRPDRISYSGDMWPRMQLWKKMGVIDRSPPDCVVWPESVPQVADLLRAASDHGCPIVPFGAGSGVCGGTYPLRGGAVVDVRRLDAILSVDRLSMVVEAEAGILGHHLEAQLAERGLTLGHFPSSILCSTLGGWVATRSAGQLSSFYGKIEDMVLGLEVVLPTGEVLQTGLLGENTGGDWTQVFVGSEGTLGIITRVLLRVHPAPSVRMFRGLSFDRLSRATEAMRLVMQSGTLPSVLRLYDPLDTMVASLGKSGKKSGGNSVSKRLALLLKNAPDESSAREVSDWAGRLSERIEGGPSPVIESMQRGMLHRALSQPLMLNRFIDLVSSRCLLIVGTEGGDGDTEARLARIREILEGSGGKDLGEGPGVQWFRHRYKVSFKQSRFYALGAFVDTMEVACPWGRLLEMYDEVKRTIGQRALVMAHFSHAYPEGCSIYFTFAAYRKTPEESERLYMRIWHEALTTVVRCGGTISHHHGIGLMKRDFMVREHGDGARLFRALKALFDPKGIMNPGKLFPDVSITSGEARE